MTELKKELIKVNALLLEAYSHLNLHGYGDSYEREVLKELQAKLDKFFESKNEVL